MSNLTEDDRVIFLLSGGGSSLLALPADGISLQDKQAINKALLKSGATIGEMNCVRKHLSAIKGGRLAKACWPATRVAMWHVWWWHFWKTAPGALDKLAPGLGSFASPVLVGPVAQPGLVARVA